MAEYPNKNCGGPPCTSKGRFDKAVEIPKPLDTLREIHFNNEEALAGEPHKCCIGQAVEQGKVPMQTGAGEGLGLMQEQPPIVSAQPPQRPEENYEQLPCYMPQPQDRFPVQDVEMGPMGPWATGRLDWGPLAGLTGTRPIVDKYSIARFSEGEWRKHNADVIGGNEDAQHQFNLVEWNGRRCLAQSVANVDKDQHDSTKRLADRAGDIIRWKCELERAIAAMSEEITILLQEKQRLKRAAAVLTIPECIVGECIERRTGRLDPELVRDKVEEELIKEFGLIGEIRDVFQRNLKDIEFQLQENKTAKARLEADWSDKKQSHEIDAINVALNNQSNVMLFKPGAVRFQEDQSTNEHWEHFTRESLKEGEATRQKSVALRGTLGSILINAARDLRTQADIVDMALASKVACTEEIRIKLENELRKILQRLADAEDLVKDLQALIRRMDTPMKKAQTRLDNRNLRPRVENCRDAAQFGLVEEVKSIGENISAITAQLKQAEMAQANLIKIRSDLEREIMVKRKTLEIDGERIKFLRSHYPSATALTGHS